MRTRARYWLMRSTHDCRAAAKGSDRRGRRRERRRLRGRRARGRRRRRSGCGSRRGRRRVPHVRPARAADRRGRAHRVALALTRVGASAASTADAAPVRALQIEVRLTEEPERRRHRRRRGIRGLRRVVAGRRRIRRLRLLLRVWIAVRVRLLRRRRVVVALARRESERRERRHHHTALREPAESHALRMSVACDPRAPRVNLRPGRASSRSWRRATRPDGFCPLLFTSRRGHRACSSGTRMTRRRSVLVLGLGGLMLSAISRVAVAGPTQIEAEGYAGSSVGQWTCGPTARANYGGVGGHARFYTDDQPAKPRPPEEEPNGGALQPDVEGAPPVRVETEPPRDAARSRAERLLHRSGRRRRAPRFTRVACNDVPCSAQNDAIPPARLLGAGRADIGYDWEYFGFRLGALAFQRWEDNTTDRRRPTCFPTWIQVRSSRRVSRRASASARTTPRRSSDPAAYHSLGYAGGGVGRRPPHRRPPRVRRPGRRARSTPRCATPSVASSLRASASPCRAPSRSPPRAASSSCSRPNARRERTALAIHSLLPKVAQKSEFAQFGKAVMQPFANFTRSAFVGRRHVPSRFVWLIHLMRRLS